MKGATDTRAGPKRKRRLLQRRSQELGLGRVSHASATLRTADLSLNTFCAGQRDGRLR